MIIYKYVGIPTILKFRTSNTFLRAGGKAKPKVGENTFQYGHRIRKRTYIYFKTYRILESNKITDSRNPGSTENT